MRTLAFCTLFLFGCLSPDGNLPIEELKSIGGPSIEGEWKSSRDCASPIQSVTVHPNQEVTLDFLGLTVTGHISESRLTGETLVLTVQPYEGMLPSLLGDVKQFLLAFGDVYVFLHHNDPEIWNPEVYGYVSLSLHGVEFEEPLTKKQGSS